MNAWLDVQLIAARTKAVSRLLIYPFVVLFLMIISRNSYFDAWDWPVSLVLVLGGHCLFAMVSAIILRRSAENARQEAIARTRALMFQAISANQDQRAKQLEHTIEEIRAIREGAFAPIFQHPIISALLLPFTGISGVAILNALAN